MERNGIPTRFGAIKSNPTWYQLATNIIPNRFGNSVEETNPSRWWKEVKLLGGLPPQDTWYQQLLSDDNPTCTHLAESYNDFLFDWTSHFNLLVSNNLSSWMFSSALEILKNFACELAPVIAGIYNASMVQTVFPAVFLCFLKCQTN